MNEKRLSLDLMEKGTTLCRFLMEEKAEKLVSSRLFDAICSLCESCYSLSNPSFAKSELSLLRKKSSTEADRISLYLELLCSLGYISVAQKESMVKTLDTLKKETNI